MRRLFSDRIVLELVEHIYAAGCDPAEWPAFVARVQAAVPAAAVHGLLDIQGTQILYNSAAVGIADEHVASYFAHYHRINPYNRIFQGLTPGRIYGAQEFGQPGWLDHSEFYNDWLRPAGNLKCGAGLVVTREPDRQFRFTMDLPERYGHLEPQCVALLERISPHMKRAFEVNRRLDAATVTSQALGGMLENIDGAVLVADGRGRVIAMNASAETFLRQRSLIALASDQRIAFLNPNHDSSFRRALAAALATTLSTAPFAFRVEDAALPAGMVMVLPIRPMARSIVRPAAQPRAMVVIRDAEKAPSAPKDLLLSLYRLTPAEADAVIEIASGTSVRDTAERLGITQTTVRNQLAAAMTKIGVHRQAELVAKVAALAPRFRVGKE